MKRILSLVLAVMMLAAMMPAAFASEQKTLVVLPYMKTENCDLYDANNAMDKTAQHAIFDGLWQYDENGVAEAALVESWTVSEDGKYLSCKLREGVTFSDGTPFNADVVLWNYEAACASDYLGGTVMGVISKIEKVDDYNVNIYKTAAYSSVEVFCCEYMMMLCPTAYEADPVAFQTKPVGTGAYILEKYDAATGYLYLTANENYWQGAPAIKNVEIHVPLDSAVALVALENDEVQLSGPVMSNDDLAIAADEGFPVYSDTGWSSKTVMVFGEPYTSDENLRKAIYYAINRENAALYNGEEDAAFNTDYYAQKLMGTFAGNMEMPGYDVELAKEYLAKSNYDGRELEINITSDMINIATSMQADLAAIGVKTVINNIDANSWTQKLMDATVQITIMDFGVAYSSPEEMLSYMATGGFYHALGLTTSNAAQDEALAAAANAWTAEERMPYTLAAIEAAIDLAYVYPIYEAGMKFATSPELEGVEDVWSATYNYHLWKLSWAE